MYADLAIINQELLYQGDVVLDFPFLTSESSQPLERNEAGLFQPAQSNIEKGAHLRVVEAQVQSIMILSQTCDVQRRSNIIICPIYKLQDVITGQTLNVDRVKAIRARSIYYWFYLPAYKSFPESIADFQRISYVPREYFEQFRTQRFLSLSDLGRHHLAWSLSNYFGRPAS